MKKIPQMQAVTTHDQRAFTMVELLVSMSILTLMLVFIVQATNQTMSISQSVGAQIDGTQSARRVIDALSNDIAHAVTKRGATLLVQDYEGAPSLSFLTHSRGPAVDPPVQTRFLAVNYHLSGDKLVRSYAPVDWGAEDLLQAAVSAALVPGTPPVLATGVLQFTLLALLEDGITLVNLTDGTAVPPLAAPPAWGIEGHETDDGVSPPSFQGQVVPTGWTALIPEARPSTPNALRVRGLVVAIAVIDEMNYRLLSAEQKEVFKQPISSDPLSEWEATLAAQTFPKPAQAAVRFISKTIPLP